MPPYEAQPYGFLLDGSRKKSLNLAMIIGDYSYLCEENILNVFNMVRVCDRFPRLAWKMRCGLVTLRGSAIPNFPVQMTYRNVAPSASIDASVIEKAENLAVFYDRIKNCRGILEAPHRSPGFSRLRIGNKVFFVEEQDEKGAAS